MCRRRVNGYVIRKPHRLGRAVVGVRKISENLAAIRRLPPEKLVRKYGCVVPCHLFRHKGVESRPLIELRQLPRVSKGIRIPANLYVDAELLFKVSFSYQDLSVNR